jgi:hypothetical protein
MTTDSGLKILSLDANSNFHRRSADEVHAAFHYHEIAHVDGLPEINTVDRYGNAVHPRMTNCGHCGSRVHHSENHSAKNVIEIVGVLGHHELRRLMLRLANRPRFGCWRH